MIVGKQELIRLFPKFKEDIQENGIDLRVGEIYQPETHEWVGCINDEKYLPSLQRISPVDDEYKLQPHTHYTIRVDRPIHIPDGYCQLYYIRSTFARCGLILSSAVGDNGYNGVLELNVYNANKDIVCIGKDERIVQAVTICNDGTCEEYDGSYQNDKHMIWR